VLALEHHLYILQWVSEKGCMLFMIWEVQISVSNLTLGEQTMIFFTN